MGKPLDQLGGAGEPVQSDYDQQARDDRHFLGVLKLMERDPDYFWAYDTISGIRLSIETGKKVTEGMRDAIKNIQRAQESRDDRRRPARGRGFNSRY